MINDLFALILTFMTNDDVYKIFPLIKARHELSNKLLRNYMTLGSDKALRNCKDNIYLFSVKCKSKLLLDLNKKVAYGIFYSQPIEYVIKSDLKFIDDSTYTMNFDDLEMRAKMSFDATQLEVEFMLKPEGLNENGCYIQSDIIFIVEEEYIIDKNIMNEIISEYPQYKIVSKTTKSFYNL